MYNFSDTLGRFGSHSLKWDVLEHEIPMWIADMDFQTAPAIITALTKRVQHGIFGYNVIPEEYYEAIRSWWKVYHDFEIKKEWILFTSNVVPAISSMIRTFSAKDDYILVQSPVYHTFYRCIKANDRKVLENPLIYQDKQYSIDFEDLEAKLSLPQTRMMILCNPHNPIGKIWSKEELQRIASLCAKHDVFVISDEIHCDITQGNQGYISFASVCGDCANASTLSVNKSFNIAGIQGSFNVVCDDQVRQKLSSSFMRDEIDTPNAFIIDATIAALKESRGWLESLNAYIAKNKQIAITFIEERLPLSVVRGDASYLLWIDCSNITQDSVKLCSFIREQTGLYLSDGAQFGGNGYYFLRMNVACSEKTLQEGLDRLEKAVSIYTEI